MFDCRLVRSLCLVLLCSMPFVADLDGGESQNSESQNTASDSQGPNFVVMLCDDLGYGDLECFGHPHIKTPRLNQLAESGMRCTNFYSAAPVCSPSRVGLLTGRSPNRAGVYDWIPPVGSGSRPDARDRVHMRAQEITLPQLLKQAGYATCMSGKWHCNSQFNSERQPQPDVAGFDHWFGTQNNAAPSHENPVNYVRNGDAVGPLQGYSCQLAADEAISWVEQHVTQNSGQPFFIYLAFHEPHEPVASPESLVAKYRDVAKDEDQAQYFANVANVDIAVGKVLDALRELDLQDDTLVIFTSDNGPETLKRYSRATRSYGQAKPLRGMKLWTTEAGFRVPGILSWPTEILPGQECDQILSSLDLLPTLCSLAEIEPPQDLTLDGTNFSAAFQGKAIQRSKPLIWCYYNALNEQRVAMRYEGFKMLATLDGGRLPKLSNVHKGNQASVKLAELTDFELYDLSEDIGERRDIYASAANAGELKQRMIEGYRELVGDSHVW